LTQQASWVAQGLTAMLDRIRDLWAERPAIVAAALIAPAAFAITLLILFLVVGDGQQSSEPEVATEQPQRETQIDQVQPATSQEATVVVDTSPADAQQQSDASQQAEAQAEGGDAAEESSPARESGTEPQDSQAQPDDSETQPAEEAQEQSAPQTIADQPVEPLSDVLTEEIDESKLRHGTDGLEGGILPIDNGVVVSSLPEQRTTWELIVPSASLKSAIVRVGRTEAGAMGSPDNPFVIGWLDSSAEPGAVGNHLLAGHRDFEDKDGNVGTGVCWELVNTAVGDQMIVRDNENEIYYIYTVTEAVTINPRDRAARKYLRNSDDRIITLITCEGSFNSETNQYSHRRVVVGVLSAVASPDA